MSEIIHIAGLLVHARPEVLTQVKACLAANGAVRISDTGAAGKCAAVIEAHQERALGECIEALTGLAGVVSVSMTSHYIEERSTLEDAVTCQ